MSTLHLKANEIRALTLYNPVNPPGARMPDRSLTDDLTHSPLQANRMTTIIRPGAPVRAMILTTAAVASLGLLLVTGLSPFTAPLSRESNAVPMAAGRAETAALPATTEIVPSPVIDPSAPFFSGTGGQSNGAWIQC